MTRDDDGSLETSAGVPSGSQLSAGRILSAAGVVVLVVFMVQNTERVPLSLLFWSVSWPLWLVTLGSAVIGALVWIGLGVRRRHRRRVDRRAERRS